MTERDARDRLELWAGLECTLNRVGEAQHDQLALTGHYERGDDLTRLAALGVRTVRYPILWERIERGEPHGRPWEWTDERMRELRAFGVEPIVGLVHHGSGPLDTNLLDPAFPARLATFARRVAERYPWVTRYTPVNEPLTTARFAALYGVWYPHDRSDAAMFRALLTQIRATRLAMAAIREVVPEALLVQTEDLGKTHSTPTLRYQAEFENERRWLTFDLLGRRFGAAHPLRDYARWAGVSDAEIDDAVGDGCPPDLLGVNHYVTSERWLDERLERYPAHTHGGNVRHRYADVEAVRALPDGVAGPCALLVEAWERYQLPIAVTEVHLGCTREQQLRWLDEVWHGAEGARAAGADVRAVTAWAAFGTRDWSSLVTRLDGHYEVGLFDVRASAPRRTALAQMARGLATTGSFDHPALQSPGWWHLPQRLAYHSGGGCERSADHATRSPAIRARRARGATQARPILVTGARGTLGRAVLRLCAERGLAARGVTRRELDITDRAAVDRLLEQTGAWAIVNAAGWVHVDDAERNAAACLAANAAGPATLAAACAEDDVKLVTFSSDLVFDGAKGSPYVERDLPAPSGVYGRSKAEGEARTLALLPSALVVRTAAFFGPWDEWNFVTRTLRSLAIGEPVDAAEDLIVSPTYVPDLVDAMLDLLIDGERGIWHLANEGATTWADLARRAARDAGLDASLVRGRAAAELDFAAPRPPNAAPMSERGSIMRPLEAA
ncbi:MAG TPA: sugar nucleotide-binding protein, partial [Gemmatimonadaceae bacterium]|nr:sugar nucleotide-binding protein [Gemmatimonadaceae bacterium]